MNTERMNIQTRLSYLQEQNDKLSARVMQLEWKLASQERVNRRLIELLIQCERVTDV